MRYPDTMDLPATATVRIEVSRLDFVKRGADGSVDFVSPVPSFYSYGSVEGIAAADGDPQDALVVGAAPVRGSRVEYPVWGQVLFIDEGLADHKWVVGPTPPTPRQWANVAHFFRVYALAKRCMKLGRNSRGETRFNGMQLNPITSG